MGGNILSFRVTAVYGQDGAQRSEKKIMSVRGGFTVKGKQLRGLRYAYGE
jgi:hypothetical protein